MDRNAPMTTPDLYWFPKRSARVKYANVLE